MGVMRPSTPLAAWPRRRRSPVEARDGLLLGGTTCLTLLSQIQASFVLCVFRRVKDHHNLLHHSPLVKETSVGQVALDKWFPLILLQLYQGGARPIRALVHERRAPASGHSRGRQGLIRSSWEGR